MAVAICLQIQAGRVLLPGDLADADPPAHFTTGVMLYEYFQPGHFLRPLPFAECFYVRYPRVELGHWPPVFYVVEALWFAVFGVKIAAARWLCACIAGGCALALYRRCRTVAAAALFLALPIVRAQAWQVMSDLLLAGFVFLAIGSLADYLTSGTSRHALCLAAWTSLAILTKGTAWLLLALIAAGPFLVGQRRVYLKRSYWLALLLPCLLAAPFFILMSKLNLGYPLKLQGHLHRLAAILARLPVGVAVAVGFILASAAVAIWKWWPRGEFKSTQTMSALCAAWGAILVGFIVLMPLTPELDRYSIVFFAPGTYLLTAAMARLKPALQTFVVVVCAAALAFVPVQLDETAAYSQAIRAIPAGRGRQLILVDSDPGGEGAMIAARLEQDRGLSSHLIRGSRFPAAPGMNVDYAVLDTSAPPTRDIELLRAILQDPASKWDAISRVPITLGPSRSGELLVYRRQFPGLRSAEPNSAPLGLQEGFRTLTCNDR
jgi:hypothetical protein